uniref:polymorphic toxin type 34 domain-containing protein n=2 Tax=Escherichia coli TaxID=562 RepID=UPI00190180CD
NLDIRIPYATDPAGNRLPDPELHPDSTLSMWPDNRIARDAHYLYRYDRYGRLTEKTDLIPEGGIRTDDERTHRYHYDSQHRLVHYTRTQYAEPLVESRYLYDPLGRRVAKRVWRRERDLTGWMSLSRKPQVTWYGWDGDRLESEILADRVSEESRRWLASCGLTVEQMQNQMDPVYTPARKIHLYHCDHRGLPLALISKEGTTEWCAEYDEWGNQLNEENPHQLQQLIRLPGQQYDEESGLYYNRHRYYDPLRGRYITQDPIGLKGGWNFYQYPLNPVTNTDPLGLEVFPRPFPLPIPWPKSPAQQQADDNAAKALTKWWNDTASQRIFDSLILNNPGLALDITMIASRGNVADTGITDRVNDIINDRFWSDGKKTDRCDVLQELIDCGDISAKDAKSTQKAWNCRHSRQSNDKKR